MPKQTSIKSMRWRSCDLVAMAMLGVCIAISPGLPEASCWSHEIPSVTAMQRFIKPAAPSIELPQSTAADSAKDLAAPSSDRSLGHPMIHRMPRVSPSRMPAPIAENKEPVRPIVRLPAVALAAASPRPKTLPKPEVEPETSLVNGFAGAQLHPPIESTRPDRMPTSRSASDPLLPEFSPWLPPSMTPPAAESPSTQLERVESEVMDFSLCPTLPWSPTDDFSPTPLPVDEWFHDSEAEQTVYDDKHPVPTQQPLIEWGRKFYGSGITPPSETWLGDTNLVQQQLYLYGDYRTGIATGRNDAQRIDNWASRLNLDLDYRITATERFHAFFGPLNRATQFSRLEREDGDWEYKHFYNLNPVTAYFEGDAGALLGGAAGTPSPFELPITAGLVPLVFQNGIWFEDAASGVAFAIPARHSRALNWANFDATFFAIFDQINSPAFGADNHAAQAFGTAWFIDAYDGYIESGYAYLHDRAGLGRSYHNMTASFTRRYFDRISNSMRVIVNAGQNLPDADRTAEGLLLLAENSLVTPQPFTLVPYFNLFSGWERPQSVARAGVSGGVLRNTGINFEIDGLNGYPTLDASAADSAGGSIGVDLIGKDMDHQWLLEASYATPHGERALINGDQYALGTRYQIAVSHRAIVRFDTMYGWRQNDGDIYGSRLEYRWKF